MCDDTIYVCSGSAYKYKLTDEAFFIKVKAINDEVLCVWFQTLSGTDMPVPPKTVHRDIGNDRSYKSFQERFFIPYFGNHAIVMDGKPLIRFQQDRTVSVFLPQ